MPVMTIINSIMVPNFMAANFKRNHVCYFRVENVFGTDGGVRPLPVNMDRNVPVRKALGITHVADPSYYSFQDDIFFTTQTTDVILKNDQKPIHFQTIVFLCHSNDVSA